MVRVCFPKFGLLRSLFLSRLALAGALLFTVMVPEIKSDVETKLKYLGAVDLGAA